MKVWAEGCGVWDEDYGDEKLSKEALYDGWIIKTPDKPGPVKAVGIAADCFILWIPILYDYLPRKKSVPLTEKNACIVLIDRNTGRPFAYYGTGDYHHRYPPVSWKE